MDNKKISQVILFLLCIILGFCLIKFIKNGMNSEEDDEITTIVEEESNGKDAIEEKEDNAKAEAEARAAREARAKAEAEAKAKAKKEAEAEAKAKKEAEAKAKAKQNQDNRMSKQEFQKLLLTQTDVTLLGGKNPKVAKHIRFTIQNMHSDETIRPDDVLSIRAKIANDIWTSAKVISVDYDNNGLINAATVSPVY